MKAIVTGAAGFMGSHLFDYLFRADWQVIGFDNYSIGTYHHPNIYNVELVKDKLVIEDFIKRFAPDVIYHMAAWAHEGLSQFCPQRITENNYNAYLNVLVPAIKYKVKRMVFVSSMSVYGSQIPPFDEGMSKKPVDVYGLAKAACEDVTEILAKVHGFEYTIVRPHNVYGPRQNMSDPYRNVVAIFINQCLRGKPMYIYGDGKQKRSFSYIEDVTPAIARAGTSGDANQIFNVGPTEEFTINELSEMVGKYFPDAEVRFVKDRPLEVKNAYCTNEWAKLILGYETKTTFEEGIRNMVLWAKEVGPKEPRYLGELELTGKNTPETWTKKLI